ncbi:helix-turn-helix domain-containing protein [Cohnella sp. JJ-181]|uniref:helix-turn-helix domain-containing protein n=1 Tax=Cohnella rhizoplanae TaxID=2974897 RepID=UPI0022FF4F71|nr:helix-turn-helix domain-containing protein [Cohnella sp. JJ-181]CAI6080700.1 HTH-type transcriptional activator RhaS [Cohnella sp. JJ-181]
MNVFRTLRARKFLQRILLSFMFVVVIVAVTAYLLNVNARGKVLSLQNDADRKLLTQINYNIENMNGIVKDLAVSLYNDDELISLKAGADYRQSVLKIDRLDRTVAESPYLHAVAFYNPGQQRFFSSLNHGIDNNRLYDVLSLYLKEHPDVPKLQLMPLDLDGGNGIDVFACFLYDGPSLGSVNGSVLILTVKPGWLLDNVKALNKLADREKDQLLVTDGDGHVLMSSEPMSPAQLALKDKVMPRIASSASTLDDFVYRDAGKKYKVAYLGKGLNNWRIVSLRDYDSVLGNVNRMKWTEIGVMLSVVLFAVLLSVFLSLRLYRPVGRLLSLIPGDPRGAPSDKDELTLIAANYMGMMDKLKGLERDQASKRNIAKVYHLRSLLSGSDAVSEAEFRQNREQYGIDIAETGAMRVAVVRLDRREALAAASGDGSESLFAFAIANIGEELLRRDYGCEYVDVKDGHLTFIVSAKDQGGLEELGERFRELQGTIMSYYRVSFTVALSRVFGHYRELSRHCAVTLRLSDYRMVAGHGAIIEPESIEANERNPQYRLPPELEKQLIEGLKSGDLAQTTEAIDGWQRAIGAFSLENMYAALLQMGMTLSNTLGDINQFNLNPVSVDLHAVNRRLVGTETLGEARDVLLSAAREMFEQRQSGKEDKSRLIADTIGEIVDKHYADPDLNVQKIADMLKMNPVYLGQVYKAQSGETVVDRINTARLAQARLLLEQQDLTVSDIMERVGFGNESYFYRLFKRRYSVTPKEYRLKSAIERHT